MQRRKFSREFKLEAVKLVKERGVSVAQAARDLDLHENVLRKWIREQAADPQQAFPGNGQMKPEQLEIDRLRKEVAKLKAERDILKFDWIRDRSGGSISRRTPRPISRGTRYEVRVRCEAPSDLAGIVDL
jgi:transposase